MTTAEVRRKHGISPNAFCKWKSKFGGMDVSDARKLKPLETENTRLKEAPGRRHARLAEPRRRQLALHRPRQADAERLHRVVQRPAARRTPERDRFRKPC